MYDQAVNMSALKQQQYYAQQKQQAGGIAPAKEPNLMAMAHQLIERGSSLHDAMQALESIETRFISPNIGQQAGQASAPPEPMSSTLDAALRQALHLLATAEGRLRTVTTRLDEATNA